MGTQLFKSTPTLTDECLSCKDTFLQAMKYTIPEFAQEFNGEYSFTADKATELQTFIDNYSCSTGEEMIISNTVCDNAGAKPYLESMSSDIVLQNQPKQITIKGGNFDDTVEVQIDNCTVQIDNITPTEIVITVNGLNVSTSKVKVKMCDKYSYGTELFLTTSDKILGDGPAGEFLTAFNTGGTGDSLWGPDWNLEINGNINSINNYFASSRAGTPSSSTGPSAPMNSGDYYAFVETSNPNNGNGQYAFASTTNFRELTEISFDYHMYGSGMGSLTVQGTTDGLAWTDIGSLVGQQQTKQNDKFRNATYQCSNYNEIRFCFNYTQASTTYTSDIALDNIKITSI